MDVIEFIFTFLRNLEIFLPEIEEGEDEGKLIFSKEILKNDIPSSHCHAELESNLNFYEYLY